jgi:type VI secretion system secreted protein Hcp
MAVPLHLWLKDETGAAMHGSSNVVGREGSIEVLGLTHGLHLPADTHTGKLIGTRAHRPLTIEKDIDRSSTLLYRAAASGLTLRSGELRFYHTTDAGKEESYFKIIMENVKIVGISPRVPNIKEISGQQRSHFEIVEFRYEEITWIYSEGNMIFKDGWRF